MGARTIVLIVVACGVAAAAHAQLAPPALISCWAEGTPRPLPAVQAKVARGFFMPVVIEQEPRGERLRNDIPELAELIAELSAWGTRQVEVRGMLSMPEPVDIGLLGEEEIDDGAIPLARDIPLAFGTRTRLKAVIGDGLHGSGGDGRGDYDFYKLGLLVPGQTVTMDITTDSTESRLDTKVALYNAAGHRLDENNDAFPGEKDSYLEVVIADSSDYFAAVRGVDSSWPEDPFDPASGPKDGSEGLYTLTLGLDAHDVDWFGADLQAGDIVSAATEGQALHVMLASSQGDMLMRSGLDRSTVLPESSPLLRGGHANLAHVVPESGRYTIGVREGTGDYSLLLSIHRPGIQDAGVTQVLFVDFDGAEYNAESLGGRQSAQLSPLRHFLELQGLADEENKIIDIALQEIADNLIDDLQAGPNMSFGLDLRNSRDDPDPWEVDSTVSRVIVGGTRAELGLNTVGIAESIDVGNFALKETAIVLLDVLTDPTDPTSFAAVQRASDVSMAELLGRALGNIIAHEAGHLFAVFHTGHEDWPMQLMEAGPDAATFVGAGKDRILGTADDRDIDLGISPYKELEGFSGLQDTKSAVAFGLFKREPQSRSAAPMPGDVLGEVYPNPAVDEAWIGVRHLRTGSVQIEVFDILGRRVSTLQDSHAMPGERLISIPTHTLPSGHYVIRVSGPGISEIRHLTVLR